LAANCDFPVAVGPTIKNAALIKSKSISPRLGPVGARAISSFQFFLDSALAVFAQSASERSVQQRYPGASTLSSQHHKTNNHRPKGKITMKPQRLTHSLILIIAIGLLHNAQAVIPPPDGGYPNFNTAEGTKALFSLTTGAANTAVGWYSLFSDTAGSFNTATGAGTLLFNTADSNTAFGAAALLFNTGGSNNTAVGAAALLNNTSGLQNTAVGAFALRDNMGSSNTATGLLALGNNTTGGQNTANGVRALLHNTGGTDNTATGVDALNSNADGPGNTADGFQALFFSTGSFNTAVGRGALGNNTTGGSNVALGAGAGDGVTTADNVICIGASVVGADVSNSCYIGGIFNQTSSGGSTVFINSAGKLGTSTSSRRFKEEIKPMEDASEALYALKPVAFHYKKDIDPAGTSQFGLVAEDVEKVNYDLVVRDSEGKPYSVRYDQVNAMLLNEFLKEHRKNEVQQGKIEEQDVTISQLKSGLAQQQKSFESKLAQQEQQIADLMANLQRLAADIELDKVESRTVAEK
jgi:hypothetical protein